MYDNLSQNVKDRQFEILNVKDGQTINLADDFNLLIYCRALLFGNEIAISKAKVNATHLFWMHDEISEAEKDVDDADTKINALTFVSEQSELGLRDIAIYLGHDIRKLKPIMISSVVKKEALNNPELIMKYKNLVNKDQMMFVYKLSSYRILHKTKDGYYYKDNYLGASVQAVTIKLADKSNKHLLVRLTNELQAFENPSSDTRTELFEDKVHEEVTKIDNSKNELLEIKDLQFAYYKLTGKDYDGPMELEELRRDVALETKINSFKEKSKDMDIAGLKKSLGMRGVDKSLFENEEDFDKLIKIGINHIRKTQ